MKTNKFQNKYRISSARATWHDYNGGDYFITICTKNREHYFGEIENHQMIFSETGNCVVENLLQINNHYPDCLIPVFTVMPNHIHAIVAIDNGNCENDVFDANVETMCTSSLQTTSQNNQRWKNGTVNEKMKSISHRRGRLSVVIGGFKRAISYYTNQNNIEFGWQERFHDHIVRDQEEMNRIATYIENNPVTWKDDKFYAG